MTEEESSQNIKYLSKKIDAYKKSSNVDEGKLSELKTRLEKMIRNHNVQFGILGGLMDMSNDLANLSNPYA